MIITEMNITIRKKISVTTSPFDYDFNVKMYVLIFWATLTVFSKLSISQFLYNYWWKYPLFDVFKPQELGTILVIGMPFVGTELSLTSD